MPSSVQLRLATAPYTVEAHDEFAVLDSKVQQAARLAKADLLTDMVGEFPELQGTMGGVLRPARRLA
jgi:glycyl-tRNA synthetase beta chain